MQEIVINLGGEKKFQDELTASSDNINYVDKRATRKREFWGLFDMDANKLFPWLSWLYRATTGRAARRTYIAVVLLLLAVTAAARIRSALLVRRIDSVLSGLERVRVGQTTEAEFLSTVPLMVRSPQERLVGGGVEGVYYAAVSNESDWLMDKLLSPGRGEWLKVADWLGYRYLSFAARVELTDVKVSRVLYNIAISPYDPGSIVSVKSVHGFWHPYRHPVSVTSADDESPQYRVRSDQKSLAATYTFDAPPELTFRAFQVNLSCTWTLRGCRTAAEVAPFLWQDMKAIEAAALSRLRSREPCPDRVLAARVRYQLDVDVLLLEVVGSRTVKVNKEGDEREELVTDYQLKEVIRGFPSGSWKAVRERATIPSPVDRKERIANPVFPLHETADQVLFFGNQQFDSCRIVPATPSAIAAVRTSVPATKRPEDQILRGLL